MRESASMDGPEFHRVAMGTIAREWGRIGITGFGGPPAHIALLRRLCVDRRGWLSPREFEDGIAVTNLLPGPASTQLAIYCAWRLRGAVGALIGGVCFIVPGLIVILTLSTVFLASDAPSWIRGAAAGAGSAVPAVAVQAALLLLPAGWARTGGQRAGRARWIAFLSVGGVAAATVGPFLVLLLIACGLTEVVAERGATAGTSGPMRMSFLPLAVTTVGGIGALAWVALKVGALSYGGGFVIVPLMQHDAVVTYHWMTAAQFLNAVALGQVTPGPVLQTVAVVGYAAAGIGGGLLAAFVAFTPSFVFVIGGGPHFDRLRASRNVQAFLTGAGAAAIGAIMGAAVPLALALNHLWQAALLALAAVALLAFRREVVSVLVGAALLGVVAALVGLPVR